MIWIYILIFVLTVAILFIVLYIFLANKYFQCVNGKCVKGGHSYKNDPTCNNECKPPIPPSYQCLNGNCTPCQDGSCPYKDDPKCNDECKQPPIPPSYQCLNGNCTPCQNGSCPYKDETTCHDECKPSMYYPGDGKATTTYFTNVESEGAGACGGCVYPGIKNMPSDFDFKKNNFNNMYLQMKDIITDGAHWTMCAASEAMMAPYCPGNVGMGCTGRANPQGKTASAPCGSCWRLTRTDNNKVLNVVVADACPCGNKSICPTTAGGADNSPWCVAEPDQANHLGFYNHFDVWNAIDPDIDWPSAGSEGDPVSFKNIECPDQIKQLLKDSCCGTYYDGSQGGSPQGCPNICGPEYTCPPSG